MNDKQALNRLYTNRTCGDLLHRNARRRGNPEHGKVARVGLQQIDLAPDRTIRPTHKIAGRGIHHAACCERGRGNGQGSYVGSSQGADKIDQVMFGSTCDQHIADTHYSFECILQFDRRGEDGNIPRAGPGSAQFQLVGSRTGMDGQRLFFAGLGAAGHQQATLKRLCHLYCRTGPGQPAIDGSRDLLTNQGCELVNVGEAGGLAPGHRNGQRGHPLISGKLQLQVKYHVSAQHGGDCLAGGHAGDKGCGQLVVDHIVDGSAEIQRIAKFETGKRQQSIKLAGVAQQAKVGCQVLQHLDQLRRGQAGERLQVGKIACCQRQWCRLQGIPGHTAGRHGNYRSVGGGGGRRVHLDRSSRR